MVATVEVYSLWFHVLTMWAFGENSQAKSWEDICSKNLIVIFFVITPHIAPIRCQKLSFNYKYILRVNEKKNYNFGLKWAQTTTTTFIIHWTFGIKNGVSC